MCHHANTAIGNPPAWMRKEEEEVPHLFASRREAPPAWVGRPPVVEQDTSAHRNAATTLTHWFRESIHSEPSQIDQNERYLRLLLRPE